MLCIQVIRNLLLRDNGTRLGIENLDGEARSSLAALVANIYSERVRRVYVARSAAMQALETNVFGAILAYADVF